MEVNISEEKKSPFNGIRLTTETATKKAKLTAEKTIGRSQKNDKDITYDTAQSEESLDGGIHEIYE